MSEQQCLNVLDKYDILTRRRQCSRLEGRTSQCIRDCYRWQAAAASAQGVLSYSLGATLESARIW